MNLIASDKEYLYSEIFFSPQGEGLYTGVPTVWVRFFNCNLQCNGFGQSDPTKPETYELPYKTFDLTGIDKVEDLPVFDKGCDSSYSWSKRYKHLAKKSTVSQIVDQIIDSMRSESNPDGLFVHPKSKQHAHLAFTGGEPMLNQEAMIEIIREIKRRNIELLHITVETNGTKPMTRTFKDMTLDCNLQVFMSVSPKLFTVSGERNERAFKPDVIREYAEWTYGQLKFVMSPSDDAWDELSMMIDELEPHDSLGYSVWIMPVGATDAGQLETAADVAVRAIKAGYNVSARAHVAIFGNCIGT